MTGFKRPTSATSKPTTTAAAAPAASATKEKVYPTYDLNTKDEDGKLVRLCGLFQKVDKKGRPMWVGNSDTHCFFLFRNKMGLNLHCSEQVEKGAPRPEMTKLVDKFEEATTKKDGTKYYKGEDTEGTPFLVFTWKPKAK
jgi:hypothetical protein